ncbi:MAG: zf-HC2 domain-containing protein [Desulfobacterales bacterium]|nr:zf-HC2 domain-containing protein [Desulfobacterales bacterium]
MKSEKETLKDSAHQDDRMQVLLALAVQEEKPAEPCPSDEQLAAFIDGRLNADERKDILKHLNTCSPCYRQWMDISSVLEQEHAPEPLPRIYHIWKQASNSLAFAMAACLALFLTFYIPPLENLLTESYQTAFTQEMSFRHDNLDKALRFPWEESGQTYRFSPSDRSDPSYRAFGAGLWSGRQEFSKGKKTTPMPVFLSSKWKDQTGINQDNRTETQWAVYFSMGRWCFLLRTVCVSDTDILPAFRDQQHIILKEFQKYFEKNRIVSQRLGNIKSVLENSQDSIGKKQRRKIASEIVMLMEYLSPQQIPGD